MKGIVFGAGFLGSRIAGFLGYRLISRQELNPLNLQSLGEFLDKEKPDIVINAIGKTGRPNIDWCDLHKEETFLSNVSAAVNLSTACSERRIYFVHLGSGCIYEGDNNGKGFSEEDEPNFYGPQFYAKTKILAEKALMELPGLIVRIRIPIDDCPNPRNIIDKLVKYPAVIDIQNSITSIPDFLPALKELISKRRNGIYNIVNPGTISAAEIMKKYSEIVNPSHEFRIMSLDELNKATIAKRSNCILNTDKLKSEGIVLPEINKAVESCLLKYKLSEALR